jgi:hypothetical protein
MTYSECVSVALFIQHEMLLCLLYCHLCPVYLNRDLPRHHTNGITFWGGGIIETEICVWIFSKTCLKLFALQEVSNILA